MTNVAKTLTHTQMLGWTLVEVKQIGHLVFPWTIDISQNCFVLKSFIAL